MTTYTGYGTGTPTGLTQDVDPSDITLSSAFKVTSSGLYLTKVRVYVDHTNGDTVSLGAVALWGVDGSGNPTTPNLISGSFSSTTYDAWNELTLASPYALTNGTWYYLGVYFSGGNYSARVSEFTSQVTATPIVFAQDGVDVSYNGGYNYATGISLPTAAFSSTWYGIDLEVSDGQSISVGKVAGIGVARTLVPSKALTIGKVLGTSVVRSIVPSKSLAIGKVTGTSTARTITPSTAGGYTGSKNDIIMQELIAAGYTSGTIVDREYGRLKTATGESGVGKTLYDLYSENGERPRL